MIRFILSSLLCCFPLGVIAQPVTAISGEQADFSRLVVMFNSAHDWEFGRVAGGYELRTDAQTVQFEGPQIFDFIPNTRISSVTFPGPGRMFLAVSCACTGDVFELRQGRLAIDIKDGAPNQTARFEKQMLPLVDGATWQRDAALPNTNQRLNPDPGSETDRVNHIIALLQRNFPATPVSPGATATALARMADRAPAPSQELAAPAQIEMSGMVGARVQPFPDIADTGAAASQVAASVLDRNTATADAHSGATADDQMVATANANPNSGGPILAAWPRDWNLILSDLNPPKTERVALAQNAILQSLSRAAAQGVVQMNLQEIAIKVPQASPASDGKPDAATMPEHADAVASADDPVPIDHLRVETVVDRDAIPPPSPAPFTDLGHACLADELLQVADWGPANVEHAPLSDLRAKMLLEFDNPDPQSIADLARRYIYLGFGAEAINLIEFFPTQIESADILLQMADIVDDGSTARQGRLVSQLTCATAAAMWAVLAQTRIPGGIDVDTNNVLRRFAGLPKHLRRHLGPGLADRFLDADDAEIAASIRDITERASPDGDAGFDMMQAHIAAQDGDARRSLQSLQAVVASGSPTAPLALAELLELKLEIGDPINQNTAVLADAMAMENRGTEIGGRLTLAAIRAYAASGQVDVTFERIAASLESSLITTQQAGTLANEAHMRNAANSPDVDFLRVLYLHPLAPGSADADERDVRRLVAARLIDLGLPQKARQVYAHDLAGLEIADQQILARADLALGNFDSAAQLLEGAEDTVSALMLARSSEMRRDYAAAADYYDTADMAKNRESAAWRAGDWPLVAEVGSAPRAQLAGLLLAGDAMAETATIDAPDPASGDSDVTIAGGKTLLAQSQTIRELVVGLLTPPQP